MQLDHIIFHALEKQQHSSSVAIHQRDSELPLPDTSAEELTLKAHQSYQKDRGLAYARFGHGWFPDRLEELDNGAISFYDFSEFGLLNLQQRLQEEVLSTGGHLFFIYFTEGEAPYLMCLLLKDMDGYVIDDMEITESHILNLDKLHFAALVDIAKWRDGNHVGSYISFLKGAGRQDITAYFKRFLCIDDTTFNDPKKNTQALVEAIKDYCHQHYHNDSEIYSARSRVDEEIRRLVENEQPVTLEGIAPFVDPDNADRFQDFLVASDYEIQPEFEVDKRRLRGLTVFSGRSSDIKISFESDAIESGKVDFQDSDDGSDQPPRLVINEIPAGLLQELRRAQAENE